MQKFPGVGTLKLSKCPGVGTKKEGKCPAPGIEIALFTSELMHKLWNELKNNVRSVDNVNTFKRYVNYQNVTLKVVFILLS